MEEAFKPSLEDQAILLHMEFCAGWGLPCGKNQEEPRAGQCWARPRLALGWCVGLLGGRMWGRKLGCEDCQDQLVRPPVPHGGAYTLP